VPDWGSRGDVVRAQVERIEPYLSRAATEHVVLTAHSLPSQVIEQGDPYARLFEQAADAIGRALGTPGWLAQLGSTFPIGTHWLRRFASVPIQLAA
jgi:protoheme ferro-lyase